MQLSKDRAKDVMKQLIDIEHVDPSRLEANGRGWQPTPDRGIYLVDPDGHVLQVLPRGRWPQVLVNVQPGQH